MKTDRLIIDKINSEDKLGYFTCISHDKIVLKTFMSRYEENIDDFDFDRILGINDLYSIKLKDGTFIGVILICENNGDEVEIGYALGSKYHNKGYMTEACLKFISYLFNEREIKRVVASFFDGNISSKRVMEKCNMEYFKTVKDEFVYLGESKTLHYYKIEKI